MRSALLILAVACTGTAPDSCTGRPILDHKIVVTARGGTIETCGVVVTETDRERRCYEVRDANGQRVLYICDVTHIDNQITPPAEDPEQ
jgi:hypothetical protein